jgi:hypothetical protein
MTSELDPVSAAQELLNALPEASLEDHAEMLESIHRSLSEALTSIDNL